jgi:hypothetical protein
MTDKQPEALQVPLHELLEAIPEDIRIGLKDSDDWSAGTTWHPVGVMCRQAAAELRRLHEVNAVLLEALKEVYETPIDEYDLDLWIKAEAAILKATGEQQ